ncbi:MAG: hypothetical protein ACD_21C00203G0001, partial [uncultured bacterium]
ICARGGSTGLKNKNILRLRGKPLIAHSIIQAKKTQLFFPIIVSSDSPVIRKTALRWGADHVIDRPTDLATATAPKLPVIQHAVLEAERVFEKKVDFVVDLDVTSPLRSVEDIILAFNMLVENKKAENVVTAYPSRHSPYFNMVEINQAGFAQLSKQPDNLIYRRQDVPLTYDMNASIYVWRRNCLFHSEMAISNQTLLYVMPTERSIDIDSIIDWKFVKLLAKERKDL